MFFIWFINGNRLRRLRRQRNLRLRRQKRILHRQKNMILLLSELHLHFSFHLLLYGE